MKLPRLSLIALVIGIPLALILWVALAWGRVKTAGDTAVHADSKAAPALRNTAVSSGGGDAPASVPPPALAASILPAAGPSEKTSAPAPGGRASSPAELRGAPDADADMVALNLRQAGIDQVLKFLSDLTGKVVMKHKDARAQITIVSEKKVRKQDAVRMICEALKVDGTSVVERDNVIWLVPEAQVSQLNIAFALPPDQVPQLGVISRAIAVKFADVSDLEKIVRPLLSKNAGLIAHPGTRKLIITDTVERIENVERVLAQLDALDVDNRQVQIFQLQHADSEELAPILRAILSGPSRGGAPPASAAQSPPPGTPSAPGMPGGPGGPTGPSSAGSRVSSGSDLEIQPYKAANWLVVIAPKEKMPKIAQLVGELDQEMTQEVRLRVIPIKFAAAEDLARQLGALVQKRYSKKVREVIEVASDQRSNSLVLLSSEQNFAAIQSIVKELDTEESLKTKTEWFALAFADAEDLAEQMNNLYQGMEDNSYYFFYGPSRKSRDAATRFVAEKRSNSLIAIAPPNELERIREIVKRLDQRIDTEQVAPRLFPLRHSDAKELADVLNHVFGVEDTTRQGGYYDYFFGGGSSATKAKVGRLYGKVRFDPLITSNALVVTTNNKENFPIIEAFIAQMDDALPDSSNLMVITLKNAPALEIAQQLNGLFGREGTRLPGRGAQSQAQGQQGGQQQDSSQQSQSSSDEERYSFLYGPQPKKDERPISDLIGRVRVVADSRTNSLMITTPAQNHEAIRALVQNLDRPSPKVFVAVRLIEVSRTKAENIGVRYSSTPSIFTSDDFDNGVQTNLGFTWQEVHKDGTLSANVNIGALVQFVLRNFDSRILSDTTLTMDNNRKGRIFVGSQVPFITNSQTFQSQLTSTFTYKDVGTELVMTPIINTENRVVMDIQMTASQVEPGVIILGGQVLDTRNFTTMLAVENNQTIVMGGILREQNVENVRRTPILGYIPIVKYLFSKRDTSRQVTELIAFITPRVLRLPADDAVVTHEAEEGIRRRHDWPIMPKEPGSETTPGDKGIGGEIK